MSIAVFGDTAEAGRIVFFAESYAFHQVMETHLQKNYYERETEYSNKFIVYCVLLSPFCSNVVGSLTN